MSEEMKEYKLTLNEIHQVGEDYYIFDFDKPKDFLFQEGQYGVFKLIDREVEGRKFRAFSIASSNQEKFVRIATKIVEEPSDFKRIMKSLQKGDQMSFTGFMGNFTMNDDFHSIFIAGGIGITPIRSILVSIKDYGYQHEANLIYSEPREIYPFKEEFDTLNMNAFYESTIEGTANKIAETAKKYQNNGYYYIAGSNGFVSAIKDQLQELGIKSEQIKFDRFTGY